MPGRPDGPFPLITLVHGGPDARYADEFMLAPHPSGQWPATAGYAVFLPNPRDRPDWGMLVATGEGGTLEAELSGSCGGEGAGPHPHGHGFVERNHQLDLLRRTRAWFCRWLGPG